MVFVPNGFLNQGPSKGEIYDGIINAYDDIMENVWDCLGVWVIMGAPNNSPFVDGDVVFMNDAGWRTCREGDIFKELVHQWGAPAVDYNTVEIAPWAHRVSQWQVYNDAVKSIVTLIDRSK